ncbi:MAG: chromate efflux transporter [Rubrobacteraceae bacterium]
MARTRNNERNDGRNSELRELFLLFTKLGFIAFGGPAAHIAMMRDEVVVRRKWLTEQEFLDLVGATNLIPGPNSTELAIHIGRMRAGWRGLLLAGACFIIPATAIVLVLAMLYARYGETPAGEALLYGISPVIIAIVAHALYGLLGTAIKGAVTAVVGAAALIAYLLGMLGEIPLLLIGAAVVLAAGRARGVFGGFGGANSIAPFGIPVGMAVFQTATAATLSGVGGIFFSFLKIGSVLFGSGYVLLAFLRSEFVGPGMLDEQQLIDAVAIGQFTPGPVFTTATFVGYLLEGVPGAIFATVGIFLPAFVFVAITGPYILRLRNSPTMAGLLDGVNVVSLALMAAVTLQLGRAAVVDAITALLALVALVLLVRFKVNSAWLVLGGAAVGLLAQAVF